MEGFGEILQSRDLYMIKSRVRQSIKKEIQSKIKRLEKYQRMQQK